MISHSTPLAGLTVVALEQAVAAPFATMRLADAGARVVKIERPEGDFARGYDTAAAGQSSYFVWLNRGKHSVVLDLGAEVDRAALRRMIAAADVFVQNLKPGAASRLGFDPADLCSTFPKLICCSISGFNETGTYATRKAYDLLIQAESGLASITGGPQEPSRVGVSMIDIATGASAHAAILEALIARASCGRGADIRISMFDVIAEWMTVPLLNHEAGNTPKRMGLAHPSIAPYGVFTTQDGAQILISIQNEREWVQLCDVVLGDQSIAADVRFATNVARVANRSATDAVVARVFGETTRNQIVDRLLSADIAFAEVNDLEALARHPELRRILIGTPGGPVSCPSPPVRVVDHARKYGQVPSLPPNGKKPAG